MQRLVSAGVQTAHAPVARHTGNFGSQSALSRQARQACVPVSQTGVVPLQLELATQSTQVEVVTSQTLPVPAHAPSSPAPQAWQTPPAPQTGVAPPQSASAVHARHVCVAPSHVGIEPLQSALARHATHEPAVASQSEVAPVHWLLFVAEQTPHAPDG